jgi:hypothetical protein
MKSKTIHISDLAKISNLSAKRLNQLAADGRIRKAGRAAFQYPECLQDLFKYYQEKGSELLAEKLALTKARRGREEIALEGEKGASVDRREAEARTIRALKLYHGYVSTAIENDYTRQRIEKLQALGAAPELVNAFHSFDVELAQKLVDLIEDRCHEEGQKND